MGQRSVAPGFAQRLPVDPQGQERGDHVRALKDESDLAARPRTKKSRHQDVYDERDHGSCQSGARRSGHCRDRPLAGGWHSKGHEVAFLTAHVMRMFDAEVSSTILHDDGRIHPQTIQKWATTHRLDDRTLTDPGIVAARFGKH
jgi:hypothetical protein